MTAKRSTTKETKKMAVTESKVAEQNEAANQQHINSVMTQFLSGMSAVMLSAATAAVRTIQGGPGMSAAAFGKTMETDVAGEQQRQKGAGNTPPVTPPVTPGT